MVQLGLDRLVSNLGDAPAEVVEPRELQLLGHRIAVELDVELCVASQSALDLGLGAIEPGGRLGAGLAPLGALQVDLGQRLDAQDRRLAPIRLVEPEGLVVSPDLLLAPALERVDGDEADREQRDARRRCAPPRR